MDGLRVERPQMGKVEPANPRGGRRDDGRDGRESAEEERQPDSLALLLRRGHRAGPALTHTRTEVFRDEASGEPRLRVRDADTGEVIGVLTPAELAALANEAGLLPGLLFETRR